MLVTRALNCRSSRRVSSICRGLLCGTCFVAGWVATISIIGMSLPFPNVPYVAEKWKYFESHKDRIDTIFVGSSRVASQIMPAEFDTETAAQGVPTHSFNLACAGMWPPESFYFLRQILELRPPHLKWVMIDLMNVDSRIPDANSGTQRAEYWHDWGHTFMAWRDVLESTQSPQDKATQLWKHEWLLVKRFVRTGRGSEWLENQLAFFNRVRIPEWINRGGFDPTANGSITGDNLKLFLDAVDKLKKGMPHHSMRPVFVDAVQEVAVEVRRIGAEPLFILAPTVNNMENYGGFPPGVTVLAFNDPNQYPVLFDPAFHFDAWHLNKEGAVPYTRLLARRFVEWELRRGER